MPGLACIAATTLVATLTLTNLSGAVPGPVVPAGEAPAADTLTAQPTLPKEIGTVAAISNDADGNQNLVMIVHSSELKIGDRLVIRTRDGQFRHIEVERVLEDMAACRIIKTTPIKEQDVVLAFQPSGHAPAPTEADPANNIIDSHVRSIAADPEGNQVMLVLSARGRNIDVGTEFIVYRGNNYVVKVRYIEKTTDGWKCRVLPDTWNASGRVIEVGDLARSLSRKVQPHEHHGGREAL